MMGAASKPHHAFPHAAERLRMEAFDAILPDQRGPVLCALPHSSREYPASFLDCSLLNERQIRSSEDAYVDYLLADFPKMGVGVFAARAPRAYLDLNRAETELDPQVVRDVKPGRLTRRISSGLGVIPRVVAGGRQIYHGKIARAEAEARIARFHRPYHSRLAALLAADQMVHGHALLLDWHSMPHDAVAAMGEDAPQIVLGDLFGKSASAATVALVRAAFEREGFRVAMNTPFAGAYVLERHGRPARGQHAIQIEIDRALYLDEAQVAPHSGLMPLKTRLEAVMRHILSDLCAAWPLAAE